jgi:hypothetical protein
LLSSSVQAREADAISEDLSVEHHSAGSIPLDLYFRADGSLRVDAGCSGCILDVELQSWKGGDISNGVETLKSDVRVMSDVTDRIDLVAAAPKDRPFAWQLHVTLVAGPRSSIRRSLASWMRVGSGEPQLRFG